MKGAVVELVIFFVFVTCVSVTEKEEEGPCRLVDDFYKNNLKESVCYLSCLSNALNKLYADGENKLFVNEEVHANASRILDDMEGKTGESTKYLSVVSSVMEEPTDRLEKLVSYGNAMGDLVAKVGGLFAEVNESVRAMRKEIPGALIKVNKYYTAIVEITRTVWDDVKAVGAQGDEKCSDEKSMGVNGLPTACDAHTCPLKESVNKSNLQKYKDGCFDINVQKNPGHVSECLNIPRNKLYKNGALNNLRDAMEWKGEDQEGARRFQLTVQVKRIFGPLIAPFAVGEPHFALLEKMYNITSLYTRFVEVHDNFTSLLLDGNLTDGVNNTNSTT